MPKVRTRRTRVPEGFDLVETKLREFERKMREAESDSVENKRSEENLWEILKINHQRSRYIYQMYYKSKKISKEVYEFCLEQKYADAALIAKWKKSGYENLCCIKCVQTGTTNNLKTCICRVPKKDLDSDQIFECKTCGCRGCS